MSIEPNKVPKHCYFCGKPIAVYVCMFDNAINPVYDENKQRISFDIECDNCGSILGNYNRFIFTPIYELVQMNLDNRTIEEQYLPKLP